MKFSIFLCSYYDTESLTLEKIKHLKEVHRVYNLIEGKMDSLVNDIYSRYAEIAEYVVRMDRKPQTLEEALRFHFETKHTRYEWYCGDIVPHSRVDRYGSSVHWRRYPVLRFRYNERDDKVYQISGF